MAKPRMDLSTFVGKLLEEQDGDVLREGVRVLAQAQLIGQGAADANHLYVGRSQDVGAATLHGKLRDVRIYRVALSGSQVAAIRRAASARQGTRGRSGARPPRISAASIPTQSPLAARLERVPDIRAETIAGRLIRRTN